MVYVDLLKQIAAQMKRQAMQTPCSPSGLEKLNLASLRQLGRGIPSVYSRFLAVTNGLVWNGLMIYASESAPLGGFPESRVAGFVEANIDYRKQRKGDSLENYLIFGEDSIVFYAYCIEESQFQVVTIVGLSLLEAFNSFDNLIVDALKSHV